MPLRPDDGDYEDYGGVFQPPISISQLLLAMTTIPSLSFDTNIPIAGSQQDIDDYFNWH